MHINVTLKASLEQMQNLFKDTNTNQATVKFYQATNEKGTHFKVTLRIAETGAMSESLQAIAGKTISIQKLKEIFEGEKNSDGAKSNG